MCWGSRIWPARSTSPGGSTLPTPSAGVRITVSTSWFVPKPHTAFQWEAQIPVEEYQRRVKPAAGRPEAGQVHHLQLARPGDQLIWRRFSPGGTAAWPTCWSGPGSMGPSSTPGASISTTSGGWMPWRPADWTGTSTPTGSGRAGRGVSLVPHRPHGDPRFPVAGAGAVLPVPDQPRTAAPVAPAAGPTVC